MKKLALVITALLLLSCLLTACRGGEKSLVFSCAVEPGEYHPGSRVTIHVHMENTGRTFSYNGEPSDKFGGEKLTLNTGDTEYTIAPKWNVTTGSITKHQFQQGQIISHTFHFTIPEDALPGKYTLSFAAFGQVAEFENAVTILPAEGAADISQTELPKIDFYSIDWHYSDTKHWHLPEPNENGTINTVVYGYANHVDRDNDHTCDVCGCEAYLIEEEEKLYIILPITGAKLLIHDSLQRHWDSIDLDLLKAAEEKILHQLEAYAEEPHFAIETRDSGLGIYAEVIVHINPPASVEGAQKGCGTDHEHIVLYEPIT